MSLAQRLLALVKFEGKQRIVAEKINTTSQSISKIITQDRGIGGSTIVAIAEAYPQLNMRWFLTGEGESGLDIEVPVVEPEDPEKELLKEELLSVYKDKAGMLEEKVKRMEQDIKEHCGDLAKRMGI